jgi:ribosome-binding protein aMBF1 (putative translation factor)
MSRHRWQRWRRGVRMSDSLDPRFRDKAFREAWLWEHLHTTLAAQIRSMRLARGWSQEDLGRRCGMAQERISRLEDPRYRGASISSLQRIAQAFDVALIVRFGPWSMILSERGIDWTTQHIPSFEEEFGATPC